MISYLRKKSDETGNIIESAGYKNGKNGKLINDRVEE
jgi:hypothetical protein